MLFNRCNKNSINKFKWKFEYEDTVYKVYDWNNNLAGYFFPNYNLIQKQNGTKNGRNEKQQEEGEVIEEMNNLHDNEEGNERMNLNYTIDTLEKNLHRAKQWKQWLEQNTIQFKVAGNGVYTAREDRNMLSLVIGIDSDIILGEKEIGLALIPLLDKLHEDGML